MLTVGNIIDLKKKNMKSILDFCRFGDGCTKKQIAEQLRLSFATVSNMTNSLARIHLLEDTDHEVSGYVGRSPRRLRFNARSFTILSLELQENETLTFYLVDLARHVICRETYRTPLYDSNEQFMANLREAVGAFIRSHRVDMEKVIGVGVAVPGTVDAVNGRVAYSAHKALHGQPVRKQIGDMLHKPVFVENDANLAAYYMAAVRRMDNLTYLYMGNGLGMGAVTAGNILRGVDGYSAEIAHIPLGRMTRKCPFCGCFHCLQTDLSRNGFLSKYYGTDLSWEHTYDADWKNFECCVGQGEPKALGVVQENAAILAQGLTAAVSILRPQAVVIGGVDQALFDRLTGPIEVEINARVPYDPLLRLERDGQCMDSMALGAAEMVYAGWYPDPDGPEWARR